MAHLFSPISIGRTRLTNRIVMGGLLSGFATLDGFVTDELITYYARRASGGVGLIITEPFRIIPPCTNNTRAHIGIYADVFIPHLQRLVRTIHESGARIAPTLDATVHIEQASDYELRRLAESFVLAAWRAYAAGFDGVILSAADGGYFHALISPLLNRRFDEYGTTIEGRLRLPLQIIESIRGWMGKKLFIGFRLVAEEFALEGITLQDARVIARRLIASGVDVLDITADVRGNTVVAQFPGWCLPLATSIKHFVPDIPVMGSGLLDEPHLADSVVRDGSVDLIMLDQTLRTNPDWPHLARSFLILDDTKHTFQR